MVLLKQRFLELSARSAAVEKIKKAEKLTVLRNHVLHNLVISRCVYQSLLYLTVSSRAVIGQFCGPYFAVRPVNFESFFSRAPD